MIECYNAKCEKHGIHMGEEGPFCFEDVCILIPVEEVKIEKKPIPKGHTAEELEPNSYNGWLRD